MNDVVGELDHWLTHADGEEPYGWIIKHGTVQRARDEIIRLRELVDMLRITIAQLKDEGEYPD